VTGDAIRRHRKAPQDRWNFLFHRGIGFQDCSTTFPAHRTCIIPYATRKAQLSFCLYNTGVAGAIAVEKMPHDGTLTQVVLGKGPAEIIAAANR